MNYITSCPACETQFLLNRDHLKAYRGKVQCGHCQHIFNAKNRLTEVSDEIQNADAYNASLASESDVHTINAPLTSAESNESTTTLIDVDLTPLADEKPISKVLNVVLETVPDLSDLTSDDLAANLTSNNLVKSSTDSVSTSEKNNEIDAVRAPIFIEDLTTDPKFQLTKPKPNGWLSLISGLLLILVLLQSIYFLRSEIAANYSQFKPYLAQACAALNCKISLPRHLDLLTIDDSDMQESENYHHVIQFSSLLINNAHYAQAYPNIELTLTDIEDKPVLRKLLSPQEYLQVSNKINTGIAAREETRINLAINIQNLSVSGYRILLTY